jgi:membrane-bound ClpP family serine protease
MKEMVNIGAGIFVFLVGLYLLMLDISPFIGGILSGLGFSLLVGEK